MNRAGKIIRKDAWIPGSRQETLAAAVGPVAVGTAVAAGEGGFHLLSALAALVGALLLQIAGNLANDYFSGKSGVANHGRPGDVGSTRSGIIPARNVKTGMIITLFLAALVGSGLALRGGWPIIVICIASLLCALTYSGGPFPVDSNGLAEITVFIFFGLVAVCGTAYAQLLYLPLFAVGVALPVGFLITAITSVNNLRDIKKDGKAGKKTLAVFLGPVKTRAVYSLLVFGAYAFPIILFTFGISFFVLLPLLSFPMAFLLVQEIWQVDGVILTDVLEGSTRLSLVFSLLLAMGILAASY